MSEQVIINKELTKYLATLGVTITAEYAVDMSQEDFAEIRHNGFGASDSSRVLDVNPFPRGSSTELLADKISKYHDDEIGKKPAVRMGRELEPFVIDKAEKVLGITIMKPWHMYGKANGLNTNFDGVWISNDYGYIPMEIKLVSFFGEKYYNYGLAVDIEHCDKWKDVGLFNHPETPIPLKFKLGLTDEQRYIHWMAELVGIPVYYYTQLQQQIDTLNAPFGHLIVLSTKQWEMYSFKVARDERTIKALNDKATVLYKKLQIVNG